MLYRLVQEDGKFVYGDEDKEYVPPNGAACEDCLMTFPKKQFSEEEALVLPVTVYAFSPANSQRGMFGEGGAAQWSSIKTIGKYIYFAGPNIDLWSPKLVEVINWDAKSKYQCAREDLSEVHGKLSPLARELRERSLKRYSMDPFNVKAAT
jgi:hypothetical protein